MAKSNTRKVTTEVENPETNEIFMHFEDLVVSAYKTGLTQTMNMFIGDDEIVIKVSRKKK